MDSLSRGSRNGRSDRHAPVQSNHDKRQKSGGREEPPLDVNLDSVDYMPLPPSPPTWEVDGRAEFNQEYADPASRKVFEAAWQKKHTKVIKLAAELDPDRLAMQVGQIVAKAYRSVVLRRLKANQLKPAARWAREMLAVVPVHCTDVDKRRFNRILGKLDNAGIKHEYAAVDAPAANTVPSFVLSDGAAWCLASVESLPESKRPDVAFRIMSFTGDGLLCGDLDGKSQLASGGQGVLRKLDKAGAVACESVTLHDVYRVGCSPTGAACVIMDSNGGLHVYDGSLAVAVECDLRNDIRVKEHFRTTDTNYWGKFRSQVRAVDVSANGRLYLFTLADEAWCCSMNGETIWGVRMPLNAGWIRAVGRSARSGPGPEVVGALELLGLALPVSPQDIRRKYRKLALQHHPDRNPGDSSATRRMQRINYAFEILTGVDPRTIDVEIEESSMTYFRREAPDQVIETGLVRVEISGLGGQPQDWVYGASFAAEGAGALLATYSGKVVEVDNNGVPVRVYDLGVVPSEIVDMGDYLYFLTPTRLYVLERRRRLAALVDVYRQGRLLVSANGFCLLDSTCFQWFSPDGQIVGKIATRDPIRVLYDSADGAVLMTRRHRAVVAGLQLFDPRDASPRESGGCTPNSATKRLRTPS